MKNTKKEMFEELQKVDTYRQERNILTYLAITFFVTTCLF